MDEQDDVFLTLQIDERGIFAKISTVRRGERVYFAHNADNATGVMLLVVDTNALDFDRVPGVTH